MPDDTSPARSADPPAARASGSASSDADIAASIQAGRELGPDYDEAIAAAIVERLDATIDARVRQSLADVGGAQHPAPAKQERPAKNEWTPQMTLGLLAMIFAIPLSAIGGSMMGAPGIIMAWAGIAVFYLIAIVSGRR